MAALTGTCPRSTGRSTAAAPGPSSALTQRPAPRTIAAGSAFGALAHRQHRQRPPALSATRDQRRLQGAAEEVASSPRRSSSTARPATPIAVPTVPIRQARPRLSAITTADRWPPSGA